jgi:hypothetical protein
VSAAHNNVADALSGQTTPANKSDVMMDHLERGKQKCYYCLYPVAYGPKAEHHQQNATESS